MNTRTIVSSIVGLALIGTVAGGTLADNRNGGAADQTAGSPVPAVEHRPVSSSTTAGLGDRRDDQLDSSPAGSGAVQDGGRGPATHDEVLPGAGGPPPAQPDDPIGGFGDDGPVPAGLGFTAPPSPHHGGVGLVGPGNLAVAPSCSHQCITKGVAYARGFGAELVVETDVPAQIYLTAVADADGDGNFEESHEDWTPFGVSSHSWELDHLRPGQTYHVMVAATDDDGHTAYAWGEFTTLSKRTVFVELGSATVYGGPSGIDATAMTLDLDGTELDVTPGQEGILLFQDLPRSIDLDYRMVRSWDEKVCEYYDVDGAGPSGHDSGGCVTWNSASAHDVDLDAVPADRAHWTQSSVQLSLRPPSGAGDALPPGYGDPYFFSFDQPVTLFVSYS